jgi:predicted DNA-binding transcriptional regulator AlpA
MMVQSMIQQQEVYHMLGISLPAGQRFASAGKIGPKPIRIGRCVRYAREEVQCWIANSRADGTLHDRASWPAVWDELRRDK